MLKRKLFVFAFSVLMIISLIGQISASFSSLSVLNEFQNGIVDIEVEETSKKVSNPQIVLPFDEIEKNTYITNNGSDCYIRAKLIFSNEFVINNSNIYGMSADWVLSDDGYYYYTKMLKSEETVEVFKGIKLGDIDQQYQSSDFSVDVQVDAIQSKNFIADFNAKNPWGDIEIVHIDSNNTNIKEYVQNPDESFKIMYKDDVRGIIKNFDSFFNDIGLLMPGDCYEDVLEIQNNTNQKQIIYFTTQNTLNKEFLDKVTFSIIDEYDNVIYSGNLGETQEVVLDSIYAYAYTTIKFKIEVPEDLTNEFALNTSSVKWVFSTTSVDTPTLPQTGDNAHSEIFILLMILSGIGLLFSVRGVKNGKKDS